MIEYNPRHELAHMCACAQALNQLFARQMTETPLSRCGLILVLLAEAASLIDQGTDSAAVKQRVLDWAIERFRAGVDVAPTAENYARAVAADPEY